MRVNRTNWIAVIALLAAVAVPLPSAAQSAALQSLSVTPSAVLGGQSATGAVTLTRAAPRSGAWVRLSSGNAAARVPAYVRVPARSSSATFAVTTTSVSSATSATIAAAYGRVTKTTQLTVSPSASSAPTATLAAQPATITAGQSSTLSWATTNAATVTIDHGVGSVAASGALPVEPAATTTYTLTATGTGGSATATATVTVNPAPNTTVVNWSSPQQAMDGFGAASAGDIPTLTTAQADFFFNTLGFSLLRIKIYPSFSDCVNDEGPGLCVNVASGPTLATADLTIAQQAVARGVTVWATEWSPPGTMKSNGDFGTGGAMIGNASNYTALASIQSSFVTLMAGFGVPIYALSPQNEPDQSTSYPSCTWTGQQFHDYIPYLHNALVAAGQGGVKILMPEQADWNFYQATETFNDPATAALVSIVAGHAYGGIGGPVSLNNLTTQHSWETEVSNLSNYDGSITDALAWAAAIHKALTTTAVSAWHYWLLTGYGRSDNEGLTDSSGNVAKRAYAIGNWAKFVRPGWHRVGVTNGGPLLVTAFANAANTASAIVAINAGSTSVSQTFSVGTTMGTQVTPWITSVSYSLAAQTPVPVSGGTFTYAVPANSLVTFQAGP
jgi:glucuronoarabinoxylan endo-1,4-beta-xylanase